MKKNIRNFCIIAHIDHGKSTLADRLIEKAAQKEIKMQSQLLDNLYLEKERGITIKLNTIQLKYQDKDGQDYFLNLIDTPGHVDFTYEVSRSLAACEGAILVVDATQSVQAQTISNVYLALEQDLEIIPVINKVDLASADVNKVKKDIENIIGLDCSDAPLISAKTGLNIDDVFQAIIKKFPSPKLADDSKPLRALVFDSYYDTHRGVVLIICVKEGIISLNDEIILMNTNLKFKVLELGIKLPYEYKQSSLVSGQVGWVAGNIRKIEQIPIGDTLTKQKEKAASPLPGYRLLKPMVFCGIYPVDHSEYESLYEALQRLQLNDASLFFEKESSQALGFGFRCGFLGMLHVDIIKERLEREYNLNLIISAPSVVYKVNKTNKEVLWIHNPADLPLLQHVESIEEPFVLIKIITPESFVGPIMQLCQSRRGVYVNLEIIDTERRRLIYEMPLAEILYDFFNILKSLSKGYASLDYDLLDYREEKLSKLDLLINNEVVDALSIIIHRDSAYYKGKILCEKLKEIIPKKGFEIAIQAAIGKKIIARETIKALRKNVLSKCYGGDISRKRKLLEKQKEGKKRMKEFGSVELPQEAFLAILKINQE